MEYQSGAVRPIGSIEQGWQLIKNDYLMFVVMMLIFGVVLFIVSIVLGLINHAITGGISAGLGMATGNASDAAKMSASIVPAVIGQVVSFFTNIVILTLSGVLLCGIYKSLSGIANQGRRAEIGDLFSGLENVQACFIYAIVISVVQFIIGVVMLVAAAALGVGALGLGLSGMISPDGQLNPAVFGGLFLVILAFVGISIVLNLIISALTAFVYPLIAERNLSGVQALSVSIKSGLSNLFGLILLLILMILMAFVGLLACLIGVLFVAPILVASLYAAFQSVFGRVGGQQNYNPPPPPNFGQQPNYGQPPRY